MKTPIDQPPSPAPSKLGRLSLILGALIWIAWCLYFILFAILIEGNQGSEETGYALVLGGGTVLAILTVLLGIASIVFGILALRKKDPKRGAAIAGLALSLICLAPYCLFAVFVLIGGLQDFNLQDWIRQFIPS
ncbi:MAG TPA: hypothetical protein VGJ22_05725 [Anaerolineales bacterium]|jgi:hypothetical protein